LIATWSPVFLVEGTEHRTHPTLSDEFVDAISASDERAAFHGRSA
jgi:hypothetical protein